MGIDNVIVDAKDWRLAVSSTGRRHAKQAAAV
jgi:hypothetical protein